MIFLTGSRAFGGAHAQSDYDFVIAPHVYARIFTQLNELPSSVSKTQSNYNNGWKFSGVNITINTIPVSNNEFIIWYWATKAMRTLPAICEKTKRLLTFETLKLAAKVGDLVTPMPMSSYALHIWARPRQQEFNSGAEQFNRAFNKLVTGESK